jgi:tetratricopeptide (TPR) repeat protein
MGCYAFPPGTGEGEPPLRPLPIADRFAAEDETGKQEASFELTDQGRQHLITGRPDQAITILQKAISLYPSNAYAYYYLGKARYAKREYAQSLPLLKRAESYLSGDRAWLSAVNVLRGRTYEALSDFPAAEDAFRKALKSDPRNAEAREGLERLKDRSQPIQPE